MKTEQLAKVLNEMFEIEPQATKTLVQAYAPVSAKLEAHPMIGPRISEHPANRNGRVVRILGVLNSALAAAGEPLIEMVLSDRTNDLCGFRVGKSAEKYEEGQVPAEVKPTPARPLDEPLEAAAERVAKGNAKATQQPHGARK